MRSESDKPLLAAIGYMRDYLRDGRPHAAITQWHWKKARQLLLVSAKLGWTMSNTWSNRLIEVGLQPEALTFSDEERWAVARALLDDPSVNCFTAAEFRRRFNIARLAVSLPETESAPEDRSRRAVLEGFGIELE